MKNKAFTLLDILIAMTLTVILIAISIPGVKAIQDEVRISKAKGELKTLKTALESYYMHTSPASYPPASSTVSASSLVHANPQIVDTPLYDPFGATPTTEYQYAVSADGQYYAIYSLGPKRTGSSGTVTANGSVTLPGDAIVVSNGDFVGKTGGSNGCSTGQTNCSGSCVDTASNNSNCGACNIVCSGGQTCSSGTCSTPGFDCSGVSNCNGHGTCAGVNTCTCNSGWVGKKCDHQTGPNALGVACSSGLDCQSGFCREQCSSEGCNNVCTNGSNGASCVFGADCEGGYCVNDQCSAQAGILGDGCSDNDSCESGFCTGFTGNCSDHKIGSNCYAASDCLSNHCDIGNTWRCLP